MTNEEAATLIEWYEDTSGKWAGSLGDAHRKAVAAIRSPAPGAAIHIVFDGPPSHGSGRFVEVETPEGKSIRVGEWRQVGDYWHLVIPMAAPAPGAVAMRDRVLRLIPEIGTQLIEAGISTGFAMEARGLLLALQVQIMARTEPCNERALPAPEVPDKFAAFGRMVWDAITERMSTAMMDETDADNAELAVKAGLAEHVRYDPEKHGHVEDAEPGDKIVWWGAQ